MGKMNKSDNQITQKLIAQRAKISQTVVSHVINNTADKFNISKQTQERVLDIARKYGYKPNLLAKGLRSKRTFSIGFIFQDLDNPLYCLQLGEMERIFAESGYATIVCSTQRNENLERQFVNTMIGRRTDAIIVSTPSISPHFYAALQEVPCPVFYLFDSELLLNAYKIYIDEFQVGYLGTESLAKRGYSKIFITLNSPNYHLNNELLKGYNKCLSDYNLSSGIIGQDLEKLNTAAIDSVREYADTQNQIKILHERGLLKDGSAVFATTPVQTLLSITTILSLDATILDKIGFVGTDVQLSRILNDKSVTVVSRPYKELARCCLDILEQNDSQTINNNVIMAIPPKLYPAF